MSSEAELVLARAEEHFESKGYPPLLTDTLWSSDMLASFALTEASDVLKHVPPHDPLSLAHTAAIANLLYHLRRTGAIGRLPGESDADEVVLVRLRILLGSYREHFPPDTLAVFRWHLHAAGCAADLQAVIEIGGMWQSVEANHSNIHLVSRTLLVLLTDLATEESWPDPLWDPGLGAEGDVDGIFAEAMIGLRAANVVEPPGFMSANSKWALGFVEERTDDRLHPVCVGWSPDDLLPILQNAPRHCIACRKLMPMSDLHAMPVLLAIEGWCECALGELENAEGRFATAAQRFIEAAALSDPFRAEFHRAAAHCYAKAKKFPEAEAQAREWVRLSPENPDARKRLSEFLYKQNRFSEAIEAWADFVSRSDESAGEDWTASLLLKLGLESLTAQQLTVAIESAAQSSIFKEQGQALVRWFTPWTDGLVKRAADRWWTGLFVLTDMNLQRNLGEGSVHEVAGSRFGEAVAAQLEECVIKPFGATLPGTGNADVGDWDRFFSPKATLGAQLHYLLRAYPVTGSPESGLAEGLHRWMAAKTPLLARYVRENGTGIMTLARLRGDATHNEITPKDLRRLFEQAAAFLRAVPAPKERGQPPAPIG